MRHAARERRVPRPAEALRGVGRTPANHGPRSRLGKQDFERTPGGRENGRCQGSTTPTTATAEPHCRQTGRTVARFLRTSLASNRTRCVHSTLFDVPLRSTDFASARHEAIKRDANLIGRAGLAYRAFARPSAPRRTAGQPSHLSAPSLPSATARQSPTPRRRITVFSELNRDVEPDQIARIIIAMAQEQLLRERAQDEYEPR